MPNQQFKILVVEDHPIARKIAVAILQGLDCIVSVAEDGEKALEIITQSHFDLVLLDIGLPGMNGFELAQRIRLQYDDKVLPLIALTAHTDENYKSQCFGVGINGCLAKPFTTEEAKAMLAKWLAKTKIV